MSDNFLLLNYVANLCLVSNSLFELGIECNSGRFYSCFRGSDLQLAFI